MKRKNKAIKRAKRSQKDPNANPYLVPEEDKHSRLLTFSSDMDQQEILFSLKSEVAAQREEIKRIKSRLKELERK
jgi:hypothetical protein